MLPGLDPYYAFPAQPLTTAGEDLDDLDHDLSDLSVRRVKTFHCVTVAPLFSPPRTSWFYLLHGEQ